jgi:hypothetical protein
MLEDQTAKMLARQLKIMNFWISLFGSLILAIMIFMIILVHRISTVTTKVGSNIKDAADLKAKICDNQNKFTDFLKEKGVDCNK